MEAPVKIEKETQNEPIQDLVGRANSDRYHQLALSLTGLAGLLLGLGVLAARWRLPLLGMHSFRQTHTAITAYWLMHGSPWFAYETPVLGAPWSVPYEFPFYQLLVAGLARLTGLPLDPIGRLVSYLFVVLTIVPVRMLARAWRMDKSYIHVFAILLLTSPIYLFWGTAFLVETFVVFFCFWFLAEVELATRSSHWTVLVLTIFCGAVGALGKITTFVPFACLAGLILLNDLVKRFRRQEPMLRAILCDGAIILIPFTLFEIWTRFTDSQKRRNPIAMHLLSTLPSTRRWYLGTWGQVFSFDMLHTLLRASTDTLGIIYGQDWSPVIPYYARRRAVMAPDTIASEENVERAHSMLAPQDGYPVEAVVRCKSEMDKSPEFDRIFTDLDTHVSKERIAGCDVYFVGNSSKH